MYDTFLLGVTHMIYSLGLLSTAQTRCLRIASQIIFKWLDLSIEVISSWKKEGTILLKWGGFLNI